METTGSNPTQDEIVTIQYQRMDMRTGKPIEPLVILKRWDSSEQEILQKFLETFNNFTNPWVFVMVGSNLSFDKTLLITRAKALLNLEINPIHFFHNHPTFDLKSIKILLNKGQFRGSSFANLLQEERQGGLVPEWYNNEEYPKIIEYIENETKFFFKIYKVLLDEIRQLPGIKNIFTTFD